MFITHRYLGTAREPYRCLFFLLLQDYIEAETQFVRELDLYLERFARNLGDAAPVVRPFAGDIENTRQHVLDKNWPMGALAEIRRTPSLLMINEDFDAFDPRRHPWIQYHFGQRMHEGIPGVYQYGDTLNDLADAVLDPNQDVFEAAHALTHEIRPSEAARVFEARPGIFGFSIDLIQGAEIVATFCRRLAGPRRGGV